MKSGRKTATAAKRMSDSDLRARRMRAQRLSPGSQLADVGALLREIIAIQAQESRAAILSIRARTIGPTAEDIRIAREETRSIVLTWCMRGTMHLLPAPDVGWLLRMFGPHFLQKTNTRYKQLGLDEGIRARALDAIVTILSQRGAVSRPELRELMAGQGLPTEGQAYIHLVRAAALNGAICFGPEIDGEQSFVLLADWIDADETPNDPQAELARRYLHAYGPAAPDDLAKWSGLPLKIARAGFEAVADEYDDSPGDAPVVRLLPAYDTFLLGYASRAFMIDAEHEAAIHPGGGIIKPSVLVDGRIVGTWRAPPRAKKVMVEPFAPLSDAVIDLLEDEAADIGRFLGENLTLHMA